MIILIVLLSLIIIGILANYSGKLVEYIKLPSLIGMMIFGMIIGPAFLNVVPQATLKIAPVIKDIALVAVLFIGGLGISLAQMKQIGRPAILLSAVPATLEGFTIALMSMLLLKFSFVQGAILGFIIAAVSPAVLIPSMIDLINRRVGQDKAIPQMLLVGASADDTIAITLFTTFLGIYFNTGSISTQLLMIPVTLVLSIGVGYLVFKLTRGIIEHVSNDYLKVMIAFGLCLAMRAVEKYGHVEIFNSLLTVMVFGFFIRNYIVDSSKIILDKMNLIWKTGKLYLFAFVGMAINPTLVGEFFLIGVGILSCSLFVRSIGVLISLIGTNSH
ncbi:MAG: cation:proton antiporter [Turicibacter sanguinis]